MIDLRILFDLKLKFISIDKTQTYFLQLILDLESFHITVTKLVM